ncbi:unnamed protein product [Mycena citricolor]|uniref:3-beta hydroxysteroid dehydrogenase/isomerase domain-containing protein n=1 Tax=Mycena citricolor TaxID=2018698 RepID=A0AAD2Q3X3_9AGAR|nr:unnamed protein product [Mycena citricolor]
MIFINTPTMANSPPTHESYLVIGGGTVIGRAIVWQLLQRGETQIAVFDGQDLSHPDSVREWTDPDGGLTRVRIYMGDLSNETDVAGVLAATQATCIFTTAFLKPLGSHDDPRTFARKICVDGTRTILRAIKAGSGISRRLVFLSNAGIFFDGTERTVLSEKDARYQDPATQADSTLSFLTIGEKMALEANDSGADGLRTAAIRPADMYNPSGKLRQAIQEGLTATKPQWVTGPGVQTDKTYFKNVSHAMLLAADRLSPAHPRHASVAGRGFFVSDGKPTPYATIVPAIVAKLQDGRGAPDPEYGKQTMLVFSRINDFVARWRGNNPRILIISGCSIYRRLGRTTYLWQEMCWIMPLSSRQKRAYRKSLSGTLMTSKLNRRTYPLMSGGIWIWNLSPGTDPTSECGAPLSGDTNITSTDTVRSHSQFLQLYSTFVNVKMSNKSISRAMNSISHAYIPIRLLAFLNPRRAVGTRGEPERIGEFRSVQDSGKEFVRSARGCKIGSPGRLRRPNCARSLDAEARARSVRVEPKAFGGR